ncbi:MAG: HEAT repeat domain-containing protein [Acidimicrobiia bacterium]
MKGRTEAVELTDETAMLVDALGVAWAAFQLYGDPRRQKAFIRAVATLGSASRFPWLVEVGPGGFLWNGEEVATRREGVERLAKRLFVLDVGALEFGAPPQGEDLVRLFELIQHDEREIEETGEPSFATTHGAVGAVRLLERAMLVDARNGEEGPQRGGGRGASLLESAGDPEAFIDAMLTDAGRDVGMLTARFVERYSGAYGLLEAGDSRGQEEVVHAFVDAFFHLPRGFQIPLLAEFLTRKDDPPFAIFLDQLAGHDLAELAPELDPDTHALLLEYAGMATDSADGRPRELLGLLESSHTVKSTRRVVAEEVEKLLGPQSAGREDSTPFATLAAQRPDRSGYFAAGVNVLRGLLAIEDRDERFRRLVDMWCDKVATSIRAGELDKARSWLRAVLEDPTYPPEREEMVRKALSQIAEPGLLEPLLTALGDEESAEAATRLLEMGAPLAAGPLIERLADEPDWAQRRLIIELLVKLVRVEPMPVLPYLNDSRWYLVRNLAIILGRSERPEVAGELEPLISHFDHRVRLAALRALHSLLDDESIEWSLATLQDRHPAVRQMAVGLLQASADPKVDAGLTAMLKSDCSAEEKEQIIRVLTERKSPEIEAVLGELASKRFVFSSSSRAVRDAARRAIGRLRA